MVDEDGGMVYEMPNGSVLYFQDRNKKYPFQAGPEALPLLRGLLETNKRVFAINQKLVDETEDVDATIQQGKALYAEKPTMKQHHGALGTWSNDEYAHPGFQCEYLRLKSFQRITESWSLFERAAQFGIFDRYLNDALDNDGDTTLHVVSLGGGPGYELLAFEWFFEYWAMTRNKSRSEAISWLCRRRNLGLGPTEAGSNEHEQEHDIETCVEDSLVEATRACSIAENAATSTGNRLPKSEEEDTATRIPQLKLASLDLQPTWEPYVLALPAHDSRAQYSFAQWNVKDDDTIQCSGFPRVDVCIISNLLVYCTDESTADVLTELFTIDGIHAILVNERGGEQRIVKMLERRGVVVVRLMDQSCGVVDDRQLLLLPPGTTPKPQQCNGGKSQDVRSQQDTRKVVVFPNVPFEEHKHAMASERPHSSSRRRRMPGYAS